MAHLIRNAKAALVPVLQLPNAIVSLSANQSGATSEFIMECTVTFPCLPHSCKQDTTPTIAFRNCLSDDGDKFWDTDMPTGKRILERRRRLLQRCDATLQTTINLASHPCESRFIICGFLYVHLLPNSKMCGHTETYRLPYTSSAIRSPLIAAASLEWMVLLLSVVPCHSPNQENNERQRPDPHTTTTSKCHKSRKFMVLRQPRKFSWVRFGFS